MTRYFLRGVIRDTDSSLAVKSTLAENDIKLIKLGCLLQPYRLYEGFCEPYILCNSLESHSSSSECNVTVIYYCKVSQETVNYKFASKGER
jgi:hypothetical protein